ncbi:MAG: hypothetical protein Q7T41_01810 [Candidatus Saccharibacteria bacterium]|nr:hypothetical protein [Candidatus Saccharibacteria bacterium]
MADGDLAIDSDPQLFFGDDNRLWVARAVSGLTNVLYHIGIEDLNPESLNAIIQAVGGLGVDATVNLAIGTNRLASALETSPLAEEARIASLKQRFNLDISFTPGAPQALSNPDDLLPLTGVSVKVLPVETQGIQTLKSNDQEIEKLDPTIQKRAKKALTKFFGEESSDILSELNREAIDVLIEWLTLQMGSVVPKRWTEEKAELLKTRLRLFIYEQKSWDAISREAGLTPSSVQVNIDRYGRAMQEAYTPQELRDIATTEIINETGTPEEIASFHSLVDSEGTATTGTETPPSSPTTPKEGSGAPKEVLNLVDVYDQLAKLLGYTDQKRYRILKEIFTQDQVGHLDTVKREVFLDLKGVLQAFLDSPAHDEYCNTLEFKLIRGIVAGTKSGTPMALVNIIGLLHMDRPTYNKTIIRALAQLSAKRRVMAER